MLESSYLNESENEQLVNLMMMRIHMEEHLGRMMGVEQNIEKGINILVEDYMRNGLV